MAANSEVKTGDLVFTKSNGIISKLIRIFSDPIGVFAGRYVPSHVGMFREDDGGLYVYESTTSRGGVGRMTADLWFKKHKRDKPVIVKMPFTGYREGISEALSRVEGVPYEHWGTMPSIIFDKNKKGLDRMFCSEMCLYVYREAGLSWFMKAHDPSNTTPDELYNAATAIGVISKWS